MTKLAPCAWVATLALASTAAAHGGPPVIERALASDADGPFLVELSEGFALRSGAAWSFVCPALFGADLPPASATLGDEALFAGASDLYRVGASRAAMAAGQPDLAASRVLAMTAIDGALLALRLRGADGGAGTEVVRRVGDTTETLFEAPEYWSTITALPAGPGAQPQLWLARIDSEGIELLGLTLDGAPIDRQLAVLPLEPQSLRLGTAGEHVFCHVVENGGYALLHVATRGAPALPASLLANATLPIAGPAVRGDDIVLMRDGELLRWTPASLEPVASPIGAEPLTCLTDAHACSARGRLYDADGVERAGSFAASQALFDLAQLGPPELLPEAQEPRDACTLQWIVFRTDLVRAGILGNEPPAAADGGVEAGAPDGVVEGEPDAAVSPPAQEASGCAVLRPRAPKRALGLAGLAFMTLAVRRGTRAKRRTSC